MKKSTTKPSHKTKITAAILAALLASSLFACAEAERGGSSIGEGSQTQANAQSNAQSSLQNSSQGGAQSSSQGGAQGGSQSSKPQSSGAAQSGQETSTPSSSATANGSQNAYYEEQIKTYMSLISALQDELLEVKQENYISEAEYRSAIAKLESEIDELEGKLNSSMSSGEKEPSTPSAPSNPLPEQEISPDIMDAPTTDEAPDFTEISHKSGFEYTVADGAATITAYRGDQKQISVPERIEGVPVKAIGEGAFSGLTVNGITLPEGVEKIDWFAFSGCTVLSVIKLPASVSLISYGAFDRCPDSLLIICPKGSYAEAYAASWGMNCIAE